MSQRTFVAYIERDPEARVYVGSVPSLPGAHSQGETLEELRRNLEEVMALCLAERAAAGEAVEEDRFVGVLRVTVDLQTE